jgi:hypothetical protein
MTFVLSFIKPQRAIVLGIREFLSPPTALYSPPTLNHTTTHRSLPWPRWNYWRRIGNNEYKVKWQELITFGAGVYFNENSNCHVPGKKISSLEISSNKSELLLIFLCGKIDDQKPGQFRLSIHPDECRPFLCLKKSTCPGKTGRMVTVILKTLLFCVVAQRTLFWYRRFGSAYRFRRKWYVIYTHTHLWTSQDA